MSWNRFDSTSSGFVRRYLAIASYRIAPDMRISRKFHDRNRKMPEVTRHCAFSPRNVFEYLGVVGSFRKKWSRVQIPAPQPTFSQLSHVATPLSSVTVSVAFGAVSGLLGRVKRAEPPPAAAPALRQAYARACMYSLTAIM
jgi:hypothetical protein